MRWPIPAVGLFVVKDGRVLLVRRGNEPGRGKWSLPGGRVRFGERSEDAAVREMREETGLEVRLRRVVDVVDVFWRGPEGELLEHFVIVDFEAEVVGGELRASDDAIDARWFSPEELEGIEMTDSTKEFLERHFLGRFGSGSRGQGEL
ncbi:MAG: NUDIX hydrolase [Nitrososphaerota archaeon]|nr:NUDIX hydrolase [Candidatus Calditenuis fumarioli]